jgi:hypothetical protein
MAIDGVDVRDLMIELSVEKEGGGVERKMLPWDEYLTLHFSKK